MKKVFLLLFFLIADTVDTIHALWVYLFIFVVILKSGVRTFDAPRHQIEKNFCVQCLGSLCSEVADCVLPLLQD